MAMTITQDALDKHCQEHGIMPEHGRDFARSLGFTIAPAEPPEAMVKLAFQAWKGARVPPGSHDAWHAGYLAALQHVVDVVKGAPDVSSDFNRGPGRFCRRADILTALGAGGRDAG